MRKKFVTIIVFGFVLSLFFLPSSFAQEDSLLIADFDECSKPNKVGGDYGAWDKSPEDFTQTAMVSIMQSIKHGDEGCAIQLFFDVKSPSVAYNGLWMKLEGTDVSEYSKFSMWVKGDKKRGYTKVFKIELKNNLGEVGKAYVTGITNEWQEVVIPFTKIMGITDFSEMKEFVIVFEDRMATQKEGAIYIDDLKFVK